MAFHDVDYPTELHPGTAVGADFRVGVVELDSGATERFLRPAEGRNFFEIDYGGVTFDNLMPLRAFFRARKGATHTFRFRDPLDYTSNPVDGRLAPTDSDQFIGAGNGQQAVFQLVKLYDDGEGTGDTVAVTLPKIEGSVGVLVSVDTAPQVEGVDFTVDYTTGLVTFNAGSIPGFGAVIRAGYYYDQHVRFDESGGGVFIDSETSISGGARVVRLVQETRGVKTLEPVDFGGSINHGTLAADQTVSQSQGVVHVLNDSSGNTTTLPDPESARLADGRNVFVVHNQGSSHIIEDHEGTTVFTMTAAKRWVALDLLKEVDGSFTWLARSEI